MSTDRRRQQDVFAALESEPDIDVAYIGVSARNGVVRLTGVAGTARQRSLAEEVARRVAGVRDLVNDIEISADLARAVRMTRCWTIA